MKYEHIVEGIFEKRLNRFIAEVSIDGVTEQVHVKNTGRCKELLIPGVQVLLDYVDKPTRKTKYSLISVMKNNRLINIDSQAPNTVVFEAIQAGYIPVFTDYTSLKREVTFQSSRFD
ncbi:MAG TPA: DNA/RNA nuclease SfsA, partial [Bacillota bacterium]|nr:DNA/RNA nuclease SfsA [Bacillota bacterium]